MELLKQYIAGLNLVIAAGGEVLFTESTWRMLPVIRQITILENEKCLHIWYLLSGTDREAKIPASTKFTVEFADYPNELREAGWK